MSLYIPKDSVNSSTLPTSPIRLGIMGVAGSGKTFSALTFPNPVVLDLDNKLGGYREANPAVSFPVLPFWNREFVEGTLKVINNTKTRTIDTSYPHNVRDAVDKWLTSEGPKLTPEQTLIVDSFTALNDGFANQTNLPWEVEYSRSGEIDGFAFWKKLLAYNSRICTLLKALPCNVVAIFHELPDRNENGTIMGLKPLLQGQSADKCPGYFTDFYRQRVFTKDNPGPFKIEDPKAQVYAWQTCKDKYFQIACKSRHLIPDYVVANFSSLTNGQA